MSIRWPGRALRAALVLAALFGLGAAALALWLPRWLETRASAELRARGVDPVALKVDAVGPAGLRVRDVRLGGLPELRIGEIDLSWSLASLRRARAEVLVIRDVEWRLALRDGRLDFGALAPLLAPTPGPAPAAPPAALSVPIAALRVEGVRIVVAAPEGTVEARAGLEAAFVAAGVESGRVTVEASDAAGALALHGEATLEAGERFWGALTGRVARGGQPAFSLADLEAASFALRFEGFAPVAARAFAAERRLAEGLVLDAKLSAEATGEHAAGSGEAALGLHGKYALLNADLRALRGAGFAAPAAGFSVEVRDWTAPLPLVETLLLSVPEARLGEVVLRDLQADAHPDEDGATNERGRLFLRGGVAAPDVPSAQLEWSARYEASGDTLRITWPECARLGLAAGALGTGGWRLARPLSLCIEAGSATLHSAAGESTRAEGGLALAPSAFELRHRDGRRIAGTTPRLEAGGRSDGEVVVRTEGGDVTLSAPQLALRGLAAEAKLTGAGGDDLAATLRFALGELKDLAAEPRFVPIALTSDATLSGKRLRFSAAARDASGAFRLDAKGTHALASGRGEVALALAPLRFEKGGLQPESLAPLAAPYLSRARGGLGANARLAWEKGGLAPVTLDLALDALGANTPWLRLRGVTASLRLDDALALTSAPRQRLVAARVDPGLPLEDAALTFTLSGRALDVHELEAAVAGGRLAAAGRYDPRTGSGAVELNLRDVDLAVLLEGERVAGLEATGRLGGQLTAKLASGVPEALAGRLEGVSGGGVIRYRPAVPPASLAAAGAGGALALEALRDFHYERLALVLGGDAEHAAVRVELRGANPAVENGRPIEFQLNFTSTFAELLRVWRLEQRLEERLLRPLQATPPG